jgi:hypothetical protein
VGFVVDSGAGAGFLRVLRFPLPILIPPTAPHSSIIRGWYNRPTSGRNAKWTQSNITPRNKKIWEALIPALISFRALNPVTVQLKNQLFGDFLRVHHQDKENYENVSQDSRCPSRDSNRAPLECDYKASPVREPALFQPACWSCLRAYVRTIMSKYRPYR